MYLTIHSIALLPTYLNSLSLFAIAQSSGAVNVKEDPDRTTEKSERNLLYITHNLPCSP